MLMLVCDVSNACFGKKKKKYILKLGVFENYFKKINVPFVIIFLVI